MENDWIETFSGKKMYFLNPKESMIDIGDIAHSLGLQCRFSGHTQKFYCVSPETLILTSNLTWVRADSLNLGDKLYSLEEQANTRKDKVRSRKKLLQSEVLCNGIIERDTYRISLENGDSLICSGEHPWLVATKLSGNQSWVATTDLRDAINKGKLRYLPKFLNTWQEIETKEAGWLAGIFDGEGHVSSSSNQIGCAQKEGSTLNRICKTLQKYVKSSTTTHKSGVTQVYINGYWGDRFEFLGSIRPNRLIENLWSSVGKRAPTTDAKELVKITSIEPLGLGKVVALETSTHTYFANGYGAHNSVAEHSFRVAALLNEMTHSPSISMQGLLHDATEAYLLDVPSPIKKHLGGYHEIEDNLAKCIFNKYGLEYPFVPEVKIADIIMLKNEARNLIPSKGRSWINQYHTDFEYYAAPFCLQPEEATKVFLEWFTMFNGVIKNEETNPSIA